MKTIALSLLLLISLSIQATTYYFSSSTGSDSYTADQAKNPATPWKTISKLYDIMSTLQPGDMVLFKRGDTFSGSINIGVSGSAGYPITFGAYGSGTSNPEIDNRLILTGWINVGTNIWEITNINLLNQPSALFINDVLIPLGRYPNIDTPNRGYLSVTSHPAGSKTVFTDISLSASPDWTGAEVVLRTDHWILDRIKVASHLNQTITLSGNATYEIKDKYGYFFQNHPATLNKDGEWCYITSGYRLRIFSTTDPNTRIIKVSNTDYCFNIDSKSFLVIDGLKMTGSKKNAINLNKASYCTIKNCDFVASGTNAINIGPSYTTNSDSITISNNYFLNTQSTCINAFGQRLYFKGNTLKNTGLVPGMGESGQKYFGINVLADGLLFERNVIDSTGYIPVGFMWSSNATFKENLINHYCLVTDDGGGIYSWVSTTVTEPVNRKVINNIILNGIGAPEGTNGTYAPAEGIYMDDHCPNVEISGNTIAFSANAGVYLHNARKCIVKNNTIFSCGKELWIKHDNISPTYPVVDCDIQNNLLASNSLDVNESILNFQTRDETTLPRLGILDNNIYCQPFFKNGYIKYLYVPLANEKTLSLNLTEWRNFSGYDLHTGLSPRRFPLSDTLLSPNKITNSTFNDNTNGWSKWDPSGNTSTLSWVNGQLDNGCVSFTVTGSGAANSSRLQTLLPAITAGKHYLLKLSARATVNGSINCYLIQNISPYPSGSATFPVNVGPTRVDEEILITATASLSTPSLFITMGPEDGTVYIDNVELYEATPSNPDDYIRFEYNTTAVQRSITADKEYLTPSGVTYASGITIPIPAFASVVLLKKDAIVDVKNLNAREEKLFKIFPNPAYNQVYIQGEPGIFPVKTIVYDLSGRELQHEIVSSGSPLNIGSLAKGIYLIRISGKNQFQTVKLFKQ